MRPDPIESVFGAGGVISRRLAGFEYRPQQLAMARAVAEALQRGRHLAVEAGTGVGKSFAYLVPAIRIARGGFGKVLVSTYTLTLQEQLVQKDIPFLAQALEEKFTAALAKGRANYLCKRRLEFALRRGQRLLGPQQTELAAIADWAEQTEDGSLSDLGFVPSAAVWDAVSSEHGNCRSRRCPHFQRCFYQRARRALGQADIIVANHALLFSDLVLKAQGVSLLPDYAYVIVDEAHNIEHVAEEHFGIDVSNHRLRFLLDGLYQPRTGRGLLMSLSDSKERAELMEMVVHTAREAQRLFRRVAEWYEQHRDETQGRCWCNFVEDTLSVHIKKLRSRLGRLARQSEDVDEKYEIRRFADRCDVVADDLEGFFLQSRSDCVYWVESETSPRWTVRLRSAPLNVGPDVRRCLFDRHASVILTSATLSTGAGDEPGGFAFFAERVGLEHFEAVKLGSPFDYSKQVTLYIEKNLPDPNDQQFVERAAEAIKKYLLMTHGRAFVLFTSYEMLEEMARRLAGWLERHRIELLQQGQRVDRTGLLRQFRRSEAAVLFGTDSFWQGVDVPGEALSNVIIVRLPFAVPDKPLIAGRIEQLRQQGANPFYDYQLPMAILKFKQGFGRLIRTRTDAGIVVVLDGRILRKRYGQRFLAAIPPCRMVVQ